MDDSVMEEAFVFLLLELSLVLTGAKLGGLAARRLHLPVVLGELFAGVVLGNLPLLGLNFMQAVRSDPMLAALAELGVIILMFEVGLESTVRQLLQVGWNALRVALLGVIVPFVLGFWGLRFMFPDLSIWVAVFLGATLCATSVGITARVLKDMGKLQSAEGRIILGAAVVDDVLGLIVLAVVIALIGSAASGAATGSASLGSEIAWIFLKAFGFLIFGIIAGVLLSRHLYRWAAKLKFSGMLLTLSLTICFAFSYLAHTFGLSPIVGAFTAGLILEPEHSYGFLDHEEHSLEHLVLPISTLLVPIFFLRIGMQVDLASLFSLPTLVFGGVLTAAAIAGKMACAGGVLSGPEPVDRWSVALGMIPRGEVGLIFASLGAGIQIHGKPLLDPGSYAGIILMVFLTTAVTPAVLGKRLQSIEKRNN